MREVFQIPIKLEDKREAGKFIDFLMSDSDAQEKYLKESNAETTPELRVLNWINDDRLINAVKNNEPENIAKLLFAQNYFVKDIYNTEKQEPAPRGTVLVAALGVAGVFAVAAAVYTQVLTLTNKYMSSTTRFFGASRTSVLTKLTFNAKQNSIITALSVLTDAMFIKKVIDCYEQLLEELGEQVVNAKMVEKDVNILLS